MSSEEERHIKAVDIKALIDSIKKTEEQCVRSIKDLEASLASVCPHYEYRPMGWFSYCVVCGKQKPEKCMHHEHLECDGCGDCRE